MTETTGTTGLRTGRTVSPYGPLDQADAPGPVLPRGQVVTVGTAAGQLSAATGLHPADPTATSPAPSRQTGDEDLPDGVLGNVTNGMAAAIGAVACVGMAEAAFNLGRFVYTILDLPFALAVGFPAIFEIAAATFAVQDARDRRQGENSTAMRAATYLTLVVSSVVNGIVGYASHGLAGLIEVVPPLMLAGVIHLHGDRATRAHRSQAVTRPAWQAAQLKKARRESVMDVLPLLAGDDEHGKATVELLRGRLESETLKPGEALLAAGWHERLGRDMSPSMLRRLETVAATVWGPAGAPLPIPAPISPARVPRPVPTGSTAGSPRVPVMSSADGSTASSAGSTSGSATGSTGGSSGGSTGGSSGGSTGGSRRGSSTGSSGGSRPESAPGSTGAPSVRQLRARSFDDLVTDLEAAVAAGRLTAASTSRAIRTELKISAQRADALHARLQAHQPDADAAATPPRLRVLPASEHGNATPDQNSQDAAVEGGL